MKFENENFDGFKYTMKVFWGGTCVAIFGYLSESEMFEDYIKEMDRLPTNGTIFVQKHW
jgi:hypothetical protein